MDCTAGSSDFNQAGEGQRGRGGRGGVPAGVPAGDRPFGLSTSTNPHGTTDGVSYEAKFSVGGDYIECKPVTGQTGTEEGAQLLRRNHTRGDRKKIEKFSAKSRAAMKRKFAQLDKAATSRALMVTLTYHRNMRDAVQAKADLHAWFQALHRECSGAGGIWKMECQERGSIHFHLLIFGCRFLPHQWVAKSWTRIVAPDDAQQYLAGTQVKAARNLWEAKSYLNKYLGKVDQTGDLEEPGRWWGTHRLESFKAAVVAVPLSQKQVVVLARTLDKLQRAQIVKRWQESDTKRRLNSRWLITWARSRKKWVQAQASRWFYDAAGVLDRLLDYVYGGVPGVASATG